LYWFVKFLFSFRYIAVCFPLVHRDLAYTYAVSQRVSFYAVPVCVLSVLVNAPKFLETQIITETAVVAVDNAFSGKVDYFNHTTYTIDVTALR